MRGDIPDGLIGQKKMKVFTSNLNPYDNPGKQKKAPRKNSKKKKK